MKKLKSLLITLILALSLVTPVTVPVIGTTQTVSAATQISNKRVTLLTGQTKQLKVTGTSKSVKWTSSNKNIASVTPKGKVTAKNKGTAVISAKAGKTTFTCKVTVQKAVISKTNITIPKGKKYQLKLSGTNQKITWKSSNAHIAAVSSTGVVTGKKSGTCKIYATVLGKRFSCSVTISNSIQQTTMVWLSATGEKYHKIPNCGRMNPDKARQISLSDALSQGFTACEKCF